MPSLFPIGDELAANAPVCARRLLLFAILVAAGAAGCPKKPVYVTVPKPLPPKVSAVAPAAPELSAEPPANLELAYVTIAPPVAPPDHTAHPPAPAHHSSADPGSTSHPQPLQISPQISPADQAAYERRTKDSIGVAEKNVQQSSGHQLSSSQEEMVEKIHQFIAQARDALQGGDYERAQNLAQKAEVLSSELVNTL